MAVHLAVSIISGESIAIDELADRRDDADRHDIPEFLELIVS